jgi:hypothetical protein
VVVVVAAVVVVGAGEGVVTAISAAVGAVGLPPIDLAI